MFCSAVKRSMEDLFFLAKLVISLWGFFTLFIILFYNSNLRSFIVAPIYEKPIESLQDVIDR